MAKMTNLDSALRALRRENERLKRERDSAVAVSRLMARERDSWKVAALRMRADCAHVE